MYRIILKCFVRLVTKKYMKMSSKINPVDNPEKYAILSEAVHFDGSKPTKVITVNPKNKKISKIEDANHQERVDMAKEVLLMTAEQVEKFYSAFKSMLPKESEILSVLMLEKFIEADKRRLKKKKKEEFRSFEELMGGFHIKTEEEENVKW